MSENPADVLARLITDAGKVVDEKSLAAARALMEAREAWNTANEVNSGDDFSFDALSATAANLYTAERAFAACPPINPHDAILEWQEREITKCILGVSGVKP